MRKANKLLTIGIILLAVAVSGASRADEAYEVIGQVEFRAHCAACHGMDGEGDGPIAAYFLNTPPSLTEISKKNDGEFPFRDVYRVIDGRKEVAAHGTRTMPVWGNRYKVEGEARVGAFNSEEFVRGRILELLFYLHSIQEK